MCGSMATSTCLGIPCSCRSSSYLRWMGELLTHTLRLTYSLLTETLCSVNSFKASPHLGDLPAPSLQWYCKCFLMALILQLILMSTLIHGLNASWELAALTAQRLVHVSLTPVELSLTGPYATNVFGTSSTVSFSGVLIPAHVMCGSQRGATHFSNHTHVVVAMGYGEACFLGC